MADARPIQPARPAASLRGKTWPWAAGSVLAVLLILAAALIGRQIAAKHRAAGYLVAAPALPTLSVLGATPADRAVRLAALDPATGDLLALTSSPTRDCPPGVACVASPTPDTLAVYAGANGQPLATRKLVANDPLTYSQFLVVDGARHVAYAIAPPGEGTSAILYRLDPTTGAALGTLALPPAISMSLSGAALLPTTGNLALVVGNQLLLLDPATGATLATRAISADGGALAVDGPVVDATGATITVLARAGDSATLATFAAATLQPLAARSLPSGARLGDFDPVHGMFALIGANGSVSTLAANDATTSAVAPQPLRGVTGALAVAWENAGNRLVVAHATDVTVYDTGTGQPIAALPVTYSARDAAAPYSRGLFAGSNDGLVFMRETMFVRDATGVVVIARDVETTHRAGSPGTALLLARAALARYVPTERQSPPFIAPGCFPAGVGTRVRDYYLLLAGQGWQTYPNGSIAGAVSVTARDHAVYQVTFTISWYQLFAHSRAWTCLVMADGSVRLVAESGDSLPLA